MFSEAFKLSMRIDELERAIPHVDTSVISSALYWIERHDWRPVWALCAEIQDGFRTCRDFGSREKQQALWDRFQAARTRASRLADEEKAAFAYQSSRLKDEIFDDIKSCGYSPINDVLFFFDPTTVEEMKAMSTRLAAAGRKLSEHKAHMLTEHKNACFERIQELRASHDLFWKQKREHGEARSKAYTEKRDAWQAKTRANMQNNMEKLAKAENALERTMSRIRDNESKLAETKSEKWQEIYSEWISRDQDKLADIQASIARLRNWISDDEARLNN